MDDDRNSPNPRYGSWKFIHEISIQDLQVTQFGFGALTRGGGLRVPSGWNAPLTFVAVPTIERRAGVDFCCDTLEKDEARRV